MYQRISLPTMRECCCVFIGVGIEKYVIHGKITADVPVMSDCITSKEIQQTEKQQYLEVST
jgi:hypothetical protein